MNKAKKPVKPQTPNETNSEFENFVNLTRKLFRVPDKIDANDTVSRNSKSNDKDIINDKSNKGVKK
jgi:hypothetical protein